MAFLPNRVSPLPFANTPPTDITRCIELSASTASFNNEFSPWQIHQLVGTCQACPLHHLRTVSRPRPRPRPGCPAAADKTRDPGNAGPSAAMRHTHHQRHLHLQTLNLSLPHNFSSPSSKTNVQPHRNLPSTTTNTHEIIVCAPDTSERNSNTSLSSLSSTPPKAVSIPFPG